MTLRKRIIVCLEVQDGRLAPDGRFPPLRNPRSAVELAVHYEQEGADEIAIIDSSPPTPQSRQLLLEVVHQAAERLTVPLTVGGGIADLSDIGLTLRSGADRVRLSSALVANPELLSEAAQRYGSEALVVSIGARAERRQIERLTRPEGAPLEVSGAASRTEWFRVFIEGGRTATQLDAIAWARKCVELGAGEILLTSIAANPQYTGYDLELTARVVEAVAVPVVASGSVRRPEQIRDVFLLSGADAAVAGDLFHDGTTTVARLKRLLHDAGIPVRIPEPRSELNEQQLP